MGRVLGIPTCAERRYKRRLALTDQVALAGLESVNDVGSRMTEKAIVLIVEDDPLQMMMAEDVVEDAGLTSIVAGNADQWPVWRIR